MIKTTSRNGFHITFANGCTISVQWNGGNYCSDRDFADTENTPRECNTVEIAAWYADGVWIDMGDSADIVAGWQNANKVAEAMARIAALNPNH